MMITIMMTYLLKQEANRFDWWSKYFASLAGAGGAARVSKGDKV